MEFKMFRKSKKTEKHKWNTADTITSVRIAFSLVLPFLTPYSGWFFVVYTITGLTDALDGWIARETGMDSEFGAKLDSVADLLFYSVLLIRFFPVLWQMAPRPIWYVLAVILLVRLTAYVVAAVKFHRFASVHTLLNKLTGGAVFLLPYVLAFSSGVVYLWITCGIALAASAEELILHLCRKQYKANRKSIFGGKGQGAPTV